MTNSTSATNSKTTARAGLDQDAVLRAALELLDEKGVEAVSIRGIADRLGVRMNTVLWHAKTKARLLDLMADAIVGGTSLTGLPAAWDERVRELAGRYRRALLAHRDGAVVVAGTYAGEPATLGVAEAMVGALLSGGVPEKESSWACWTIVYFALGLVQEEQAFPGADAQQRFTAALSPVQHPALTRVLPHVTEGSFDERFAFGLNLILHSLSPR